MQKNDVTPACEHLAQAVNTDKHYFQVFIRSMQKAIDTLGDTLRAEYRQRNCECETCKEAWGICVYLNDIIETVDCYSGINGRPKDAENALSVISAITTLRVLCDLPKKLASNASFTSALTKIKEVENEAENVFMLEWKRRRKARHAEREFSELTYWAQHLPD